ncbi:efflux RND transporter periplasmic adaptor subunit [Methylocapsa aurea]|uniref:efflux RND transporter periplasmic adaptor subunit n=1 Tax=Methylocapsa aurea TaxID=663610 RepID=UPI003D18CE77
MNMPRPLETFIHWRRSAEPRVGKGALISVGVASALIGSWFPQIAEPFRSVLAPKSPMIDAQKASDTVDGLIKLTAEQIAAAEFAVRPVQAGVLTRRINVPALVSADTDRVGHVAAKVVGTVAELRKNIGDWVESGETIAYLESREVADAKSDFLASLVSYNLQQQLFQREKGLFEKKITAEQAFLRAQTALSEAQLRLDLARQKLAALDLSEAEISALPKQPTSQLRRKEIRAPISGRVTERRASLGQPVGVDGELYVIADLSVVWADLSVALTDLPNVRREQAAQLVASDGRRLDGSIIFVSPLLSQGTQSARVVARFPNPDLALRPGVLLTARVDLERLQVRTMIPRTAVQLVNREPSVFVRVSEGFVRRKIETGASDEESVEVVADLALGELIATANTFALKAELGRLLPDLAE